jgi:hypothetical protein
MRREAVLGAPVKPTSSRFTIGFATVVSCLALFLPLFRLTSLFTFVTEKIILARLPVTRYWLGLEAPATLHSTDCQRYQTYQRMPRIAAKQFNRTTVLDGFFTGGVAGWIKRHEKY